MSKFKFQATRVFLTYSQCPATPELLLEHFKDLFEGRKEDIKEYLICQEKHKETNGYHLHAYIRLSSRLSITNSRFFDLELIHDYVTNETCSDGETDIDEYNKIYHPNIEAVKNYKHVTKYIKKDGIFITNINEKELFNVWHKAIELAKNGDTTKALNELIENKPRDYLLYGLNIQSNINSLVIDEYEKYNLDNYNIPEGVTLWKNKYINKRALWLYGPSGIGKTTMMLSMFKNGIRINHLDKLKKFKKNINSVLIFDDMNFKGQSRELGILLADIKQPSDINVKHGMVTIPAGTPRVFISNVNIWPVDYANAIHRRIFKVELNNNKLYKNINEESDSDIPIEYQMYPINNEININNNNKGFNYNNNATVNCGSCGENNYCNQCSVCINCDICMC